MQLVLLLGVAIAALSSNVHAQNLTTNATTSSTQPLVTPPPVTPGTNGSIGWFTTGTNPVIPGVVLRYCYGVNSLGEKGGDAAPCEVWCAENNTACLDAATSEANLCSPQWAAYQSSSSSWASVYRPGLYTLTWSLIDEEVSSVFSSYSTDSTESFPLYQGGYFHAVYGLGSASLTTKTTSDQITFTFASNNLQTTAVRTYTATTKGMTLTETNTQLIYITSGYTLPTPACSITAVQSMTCGLCTIDGGSVQVYYWPAASATTASDASNATSTSYANISTPAETRIAVVDGITMTSPSVYISLQTVYASNECSAVGANYSGSILTMRAEDVSTVWGAGAPGYGPADASQFNFADLDGIVPASVYEENNACARFGCPIIANDYYRPTIAIPPQIRSLDPAWGACALDLNGMYDPPVALQAQTTVAGPSVPAAGTTTAQTTTTTPAAPISAVANTLPPATATPTSSSTPQSSSPPSSSEQAQPSSTPANTPSTSGVAPSDSSAAGGGASETSSSPSPSEATSKTESADPGGVIASIIGLSRTTSSDATASTRGSHATTASSEADNKATVDSGTTPASRQISSTTPQAVPLVIGSSTITPNSASEYVVSGQTLAPGSSVTLGSGSSATVVGLQTTGSRTVLVVGSSTSTIAHTTGPVSVTPAPITVGSTVLQPNSDSGFTAGSQTLTPGGTITFTNGPSKVVVALHTTGSETLLVVDSSTSTLKGATILHTSAAAGPITVGSSVITPDSASDYIIGSQTLTPGGVITLASGTSSVVVALHITHSQTLLVVGGSTSTLKGTTIPHTTTAAAAGGPITVGTSVIIADSASNYIIGAQTLSPGGPAITVAGTRYSLGSAGTDIVIGSSTTVIETHTTPGLGDYIWAGIGGAAAAAASANGQTTTAAESSSLPPAAQLGAVQPSSTAAAASLSSVVAAAGSPSATAALQSGAGASLQLCCGRPVVLLTLGMLCFVWLSW